MIEKKSKRRRFQAARFVAQASTFALVAALPAHAMAQCSPDPTQANTAVTYSGTDSDGITVTSNASNLTVVSGASVTNTGSAAIAVAIPVSASSYYRYANITVNGSVSATGAAGINVVSGPLAGSSYDYYGTSAAITVGSGAAISGTTGISLSQSPGVLYGSAQVSLDNAGTITGTSGVALSTNSNYTSFTSILNRAGGVIGAISGALGTLTNEGTISGDAQSALYTSTSLYASIANKGTINSSSIAGTIVNYAGTLTNSGTITNSGGGAVMNTLYSTLTNLAGGAISGSGASVLNANSNGTLTVTNSGTITNTGSGNVIYAGQVNVTNNAEATIGAGAGGTALAAGTLMILNNSGTINGNVTAGLSPAYVTGSIIDSSRGTINGNLTLGNGDDTLIASYRNGGLYTGITGTLDAGGGTNKVKLVPSQDVTINSALVLPTSFSSFSFAPDAGTTLTLGDGFVSTGTLFYEGSGALVNETSLSGNGTILNGSGLAGTFTNKGSISSSNIGGGAAVVLSGYARLNNAGTILANGNAVNSFGGGVTNSGTITAGGTAVTSFGDFGNSGTIQSTGGTGAALSFSCTCSTGTNSGTISGALIGVSMGGGVLVNTGTIQSGGTAFQIQSYSTLDNRAGAVVTGGGAAVASIGYGFNNRVFNAGTINGNVNLAGNSPNSGNLYYAVTGGVLNGNLTLGQGDTLITDLINTGPGAYAGINGSVTASNTNLIYNVGANASATTALPTGFSTLGFQLANKANLTLTGQSALASSLTLAGVGSVNLNGSLSSSSGPVILTTAFQTPSGGGGDAAATALAITNNGSISATRAGSAPFSPNVISMGQGSSLTNNGSIIVTDTLSHPVSGAAGIMLYGALVNTGTISVDGAQGIAIGSTWNTGNTRPDTTLANSGQITADGSAIVLNGKVDITNSGTITSRTAPAILQSYGYNSIITNLAGSTIAGAGTAILSTGGVVDNAGTINGDVNFAYSNGGAYVANGGTLNGNLNFGGIYSTGLLVETGSGLGINGTISAGSGALGHQRRGVSTVTLGGALPANFTTEFTVADGANSRITIAGPTGYTANINVGGNGAIVNQLSTTGAIYSLAWAGINYLPFANTDLGGFTNRANVGGAFVATSQFDNSATIGSSGLAASAVTVSAMSGLNFVNSGTILNAGIYPALSISTGSTGGDTAIANTTIGNSGTIVGGMNAYAVGDGNTTFSIVNSGTITGYRQRYYVYSPTPPYYSIISRTIAITASAQNLGNLSLNNSGTITGDISLTGAPVLLTNTGAITGNITTGTGNDRFAFGGTFAGALNGGGGTNTLAISAGSQSFSSIANIAALVQSGGLATISGAATLGSANMTGGQLVGLGGSVINAPSIMVGSGATFGSAGTVNGNISVSGILSPGASPGTMTVNGNVALASGSTSLFEIAPTAQDKLNINGALVIAPGSTLQIAATTPIRVGSTLNLISATGGVTGSFDAVTGLAGVVKPQANGDLGLLVQFANGPAFNPQVRRTIAYVNSAMAANDAPAALFPALLALQDGNGAPIAAAFARIAPEPFADAMEIGTETALSLSATGRTLGMGENRGEGHVYAFGQALGSLRQFAGDAAQGINRATINGYGVLGGLGIGGEGYALSAYVGWVDQNQSLGAIGASTNARGAVGGLALRLGNKQTSVTLAASYDAARATTRRNVPDAGQVAVGYSLPSFSLDASISHAFALSRDWIVRPHLGATWVRTHHGVVQEASAHPFALNVQGATRKQGFLDAGLSFESPDESKGPWRRFLTLGMRYRLQDDQATATAALAGGGYGLVAYGFRRDPVSAMASIGGEYRLAPGAALFFNATGELGQSGKRESVMAGVRWRM